MSRFESALPSGNDEGTVARARRDEVEGLMGFGVSPEALMTVRSGSDARVDDYWARLEDSETYRHKPTPENRNFRVVSILKALRGER